MAGRTCQLCAGHYHINNTFVAAVDHLSLSSCATFAFDYKAQAVLLNLKRETMKDVRYRVLAIPLNRPEIVDFLQPVRPESRGQAVRIIGQRPTRAAEAAWVNRLNGAEPTLADLLALDDPHGHLVNAATDRLIPAEKLGDARFLTNNLGGWAPIYFAVAGLAGDLETTADPLLKQAEVMADYGETIRYFGADPIQVQARLEVETGLAEVGRLAHCFARLQQVRQGGPAEASYAAVERLYDELISKRHFGRPGQRPIPPLLLYDALLGEMVRIETARRQALADGSPERAEAIAAWLEEKRQATGLQLILKGEYIVGRARRSTVLIAPELGIVVKQPGPEPFHEIKLAARIYRETAENWPYLTGDGALVTPRGRMRLIVEEDLLPQISRVFDFQLAVSALMGLTVEEFVPGQTVQQMVLDQPERLTAELYDAFVLQQQVCELLGIENGDWHSANFMHRPRDGRLVHIDWGAARPLRPQERTPQGRLQRLNQMRNIAFSFHDQRLAERVLYLHEALVGDDARLAQIREKAQALVDATK